MKTLENLPEIPENKSSKFIFVGIFLTIILCVGLAVAVFIYWKRTSSSGKEVKKEIIQVPVAKVNPESDLTFYKNLKNKGEPSARKENIVGLIPPAKSGSRLVEPSSANGPKKGASENLTLSPRFTLQVASLKDHKKALYLSERLARKGFPSYVISVQIPDKGIYYRVRIGHYVTKKAAEESLEKLKQKGEKEAIIAKENVMTRAR